MKQRGLNAALAIAGLLVLGAPGRAFPQQALPRFDLQDKEGVLIALGYYDDRSGFPRTAMVAMEGNRVVPWLVEVATDTSLHLDQRRVAILAIGLTRNTAVAPVLIQLAEQRATQYEALNALVGLSSPAVCDFWETTLGSATEQERVARYNAIRGLSYCDRRHEQRIRAIGDSTRDSGIRRAVLYAIGRFAMPDSQRLVGPKWAGPPRSDGVYEPSERDAARIRQEACSDGCPVGLLPPDFFIRGRRQR